MVNKLFFNKRGTYEWILVRISAFIILLYLIYIIFFIFTVNNITYEIWRNFFLLTKTKIFTSITLLSSLIHMWIGINNIVVDYIKSNFFKKTLQLLIVITIIIYIIYGNFIIWEL